jgi:hypothetical protein
MGDGAGHTGLRESRAVRFRRRGDVFGGWNMRRTPVFLFTILAIVSLFAYLPVFDNGFRRDDYAFLEQMVEFGGSWRVFAPIYRFAFFRPGAIALFHVEYAIFGLNSTPYLIVNYLLHLAVALVGWRVLRRLEVGEWAAALGAGLFLVGFGHYGKTVIWASSCGSVAASLLCVVAIDLASRPLEGFRAKAALVAVVIIAPSFHEIGLLAGILAFFRARHAGPSARRWSAIGAGVSLLGWIAAWIALSRLYRPYGDALSGIPRIAVQLARYLSLFLLPIEKSATASAGIQRITEIVGWLRVPVGVSVALGLGLLAKRVRSTRFLVLWIVLGLVPFTLVGLPGNSPQLRYTYTAALPWCAVVAFLLVRLPWRRLAIALTTAIVAYSVSIHVLIEHHYDRSTQSWLNRALRSELQELQRKVSERDGR